MKIFLILISSLFILSCGGGNESNENNSIQLENKIQKEQLDKD